MKGQRKRAPSSPLVASLQSPTTFPSAKKLKMTPDFATESKNQNVSDANAADPGRVVGDGEWTKVEKRRAKKMKNMEARANVRRSVVSLLV